MRGLPVDILGNLTPTSVGEGNFPSLHWHLVPGVECQDELEMASAEKGQPMAVSVGDVVRITARLLLNNIGDVVNVYHFFVNTNTTANDAAFMTELALAMDTLYTPVNAAVHQDISYVSVDGQNITDNQLLPTVGWPVLTVGGNATEMLPEMVAACVFWRTLRPKVRTAKFLPPFGENQNVDGALAAATVILLQAFGDALTAGLTGPNIAVVYGAYNKPLDRFEVVAQALTPARFRTQKRRRLGVGS